MTASNPAAQLQDQLTSRWDVACRVLDKGESLSERFKASLEDYHQLMERFDAVEASARRAGLMLCIRDEGTCEGQAVSCLSCVQVL